MPRLILLILLSVIALPSCAQPRTRSTTVLTAADMEISANEVRQDLASSDFLAGRTPDSPPIILQPDRLQNYSNERLSYADKLAAVTRLLYDRAMQELFQQRNVAVLLPLKDRWRAARIAPDVDVDPFEAYGMDHPGSGLTPTHALHARFDSITRTGAERQGDAADVRSDLFVVEYSIVDLATRRTVWTASSLIKRVAHGSLVD